MPTPTGPADEADDALWRKSSFSAAGACVSWRHTPDGVEVRDTKHPHAGSLHFNRTEWVAFLDGAKAGEADPPAAE